MQTVHIELISDFICPWCYLGKVRLERVKNKLKGEINLDIAVKPYVLYPKIPKGGAPKAIFAKKTKPGMGRTLRIEAETEGIQFNYKYIERIPRSFEAHRLVWLIDDNAIKYELAKRLFHGYFEEGQNIEDQDYLIKQAKDLNVSDDVINIFKTTADGTLAVENYIQDTKAAFINVVPSMRLDHKFLITGLQAADVLEKYIRRAAKIQLR